MFVLALESDCIFFLVLESAPDLYLHSLSGLTIWWMIWDTSASFLGFREFQLVLNSESEFFWCARKRYWNTTKLEPLVPTQFIMTNNKQQSKTKATRPLLLYKLYYTAIYTILYTTLHTTHYTMYYTYNKLAATATSAATRAARHWKHKQQLLWSTLKQRCCSAVAARSTPPLSRSHSHAHPLALPLPPTGIRRFAVCRLWRVRERERDSERESAALPIGFLAHASGYTDKNWYYFSMSIYQKYLIIERIFWFP